MDTNKIQLLKEQIEKLNGVISVLQTSFPTVEVEDEINFLYIVRGNLKTLAGEE